MNTNKDVEKIHLIINILRAAQKANAFNKSFVQGMEATCLMLKEMQIIELEGKTEKKAK